MEEFLGKKYVLTHSENLEDYLKHIGVGYVARKLAMNMHPVQSLTRNEDGTYLFNVLSAVFNWDVVFTPGVEFDEKKPDGQTVKAIFTFEGNKMTHVQKHDEGKHSTHVIEFYPDKTIMKTTAVGLDKVAIRHYKLVE